MAVEFTPEQQSAIDSRGGALIVAAAAGSGKTAVLVERVIRRVTDVENPADIDSLLIVTFTNAAAGEMRERVAASLLRQLAQNPGSGRLRRQLALLGSARIQTVHSFCLDLVRQNFSLCGVSPSFRLLDKAESELLKDQAMEEALEKKYAQEQGDLDFQAAVENFAEDRGDRKLQSAARELYNKLRSHADPQGWLDRAIETVKLAAGSQPQDLPWSQELLKFCLETLDYQQRRLLQAGRLLEEDPKVQEKYGPAFDYCLAAAQTMRQAAAQGWDECYQALSLFEKPRLAAVRGADKELTDQLKQAKDDFSDSVAFLAQQVVSRPGEQVRREMALSLPILRGLAGLERAFEAEYDQIKRRENVLDFSDLEHLALGLLTDEKTGAPSQLAQQLAQGITEILVDEYQDTNEIQDSIFSALRRKENSLFMVGDVKQSIYRFRLAEPEIFVGKYYQYQDYEIDPEAPQKRIMLNRNFRSRREVLELTNFIFRRLMSRDFGGVDYNENEELRQGQGAYDGACPAEVYLLDMQRDRDGEEESVEKAVYEAEFVGSLVVRQLRETQITDKQTGLPRPARPDDIAILLSSFSNKAPLYQQALERRGIPSSAGGGNFYASIETAVMRSMLAVIDNPRQDIPLISVMRSPLYLFTPDELLAIRQEEKQGDFYDALLQSQLPHAQSFLADLREFRAYRPDVSVGRLVSLIYARTGALGVFQALDNGAQRRRNLQRFYQLALQYENSGSRGLFGFLRSLEKRAQEGEPPADPAPGAVRLMSVHGSKGLEFPIVILPDLDKRFNTDDLRQAMAMHKGTGLAFRLRDLQRRLEYKTQMQQAVLLRCRQESREEELRKLYVAMTRAQEKLILTMALTKAADRLRQWEGLYDDQGRLPVGAAADQASAAAWVGAPLLRHPAGAPLREYAGLPLRAPDQDARAGDLYCAVVPFDAGLQQQNVRQIDVQPPAEQLTLDMPRYRLLQQFVYPHETAVRLPSKLTPTGLNRLDQDSALIEWESEEGEEARPRLRLYQTKSRGEAARMGSAVHRCMQLIRWENCQTPEAAAQELGRLRRQGKLGPETVWIPAEPVAAFVRSPLGRLAQSCQCLREYQFSALFTPAELGLEGGEEEQILMNGVIDLAILTPDGVEIVDFKSDRLTPGQEGAQAEKYRRQLDIYAKAAEKVLELPSLGRWIYFLSSGQAIEIGADRRL